MINTLHGKDQGARILAKKSWSRAFCLEANRTRVRDFGGGWTCPLSVWTTSVIKNGLSVGLWPITGDRRKSIVRRVVDMGIIPPSISIMWQESNWQRHPVDAEMLCSTLIGFSLDSFVYPRCADPPSGSIFLLHALKLFPRFGLILIRKWVAFCTTPPRGCLRSGWVCIWLTPAPFEIEHMQLFMHAPVLLSFFFFLEIFL